MIPILAAALAVAAYVAAVFWFRLANPDLPIFPWDTTAWWFPGIEFVHDSLMRGELPLWNPYQLAGSPFLAMFSCGLSPLLMVFALLPPHVALVAHTAFHMVLGGVFTVLFARRIGVNTVGGVAAAIAFIGSFQMVGSANVLGAYLSTFVWLPAVLLALHRLVADPRLGNGLLFTLVAALLFLAGHIQAVLYIVQVGGLYALYLSIDHSWPHRAKVLGCLVGFSLLASCLVGIQLLTTLDLAASGTRNLGGLSLERAGGAGISASAIWSGLTGRGFGYVGLPVLFVPLAVAACLRADLRRQALFFVLIFALTLDFMRGADGFVFRIHYALPMGDVFRIPYRIGFVMEFAAAMLVGIGISAVATWPRLQASWMQGLALMLLLCVAGDMYLRNPTSFRYDPLTAPDSLYAPKRLVEFAEDSPLDRMFFVGDHVPLKFGQIHGYFVVPDYEAILPGRYARFFGIPSDMIWHGQLAVVPSKPSIRGMDPFILKDPRLFDLMSVKYYVDGRFPRQLLAERGEVPGAGTQKISRLRSQIEERALERRVEGRRVLSGFPGVYERASALPRTYLVHDLKRAESQEQALEWVHKLDFDPSLTAVVNADVSSVEPLPLNASEYAEIAEYGAQRVSVRASCASRCLLVLTDLYDEKWRAELAGREVPILQVNYLFRGVELAPGEHLVEFVYDPKSFRNGVIVSCAGLLVFAFLAVLNLRGRRS